MKLPGGLFAKTQPVLSEAHTRNGQLSDSPLDPRSLGALASCPLAEGGQRSPLSREISALVVADTAWHAGCSRAAARNQRGAALRGAALTQLALCPWDHLTVMNISLSII